MVEVVVVAAPELQVAKPAQQVHHLLGVLVEQG